jgi:hypothetical protein
VKMKKLIVAVVVTYIVLMAHVLSGGCRVAHAGLQCLPRPRIFLDTEL